MDELSGKQASSSVLERKKMQVSELVFEKKFTMTEEISICRDLSPSLSSIVFILSHSYFEMLGRLCYSVWGKMLAFP